jgi:hypothetical protein
VLRLERKEMRRLERCEDDIVPNLLGFGFIEIEIFLLTKMKRHVKCCNLKLLISQPGAYFRPL